MVEDDRACTDILIQIAAVRSAVNSIGKSILQEHLSNCIADAIGKENKEMAEALNDAVQKLL